MRPENFYYNSWYRQYIVFYRTKAFRDMRPEIFIEMSGVDIDKVFISVYMPLQCGNGKCLLCGQLYNAIVLYRTKTFRDYEAKELLS